MSVTQVYFFCSEFSKKYLSQSHLSLILIWQYPTQLSKLRVKSVIWSNDCIMMNPVLEEYSIAFYSGLYYSQWLLTKLYMLCYTNIVIEFLYLHNLVLWVIPKRWLNPFAYQTQSPWDHCNNGINQFHDIHLEEEEHYEKF